MGSSTCRGVSAEVEFVKSFLKALVLLGLLGHQVLADRCQGLHEIAVESGRRRRLKRWKILDRLDHELELVAGRVESRRASARV